MTRLFCQQSEPTLVEAERNTYKLLTNYAHARLVADMSQAFPALSQGVAVKRR